MLELNDAGHWYRPGYWVFRHLSVTINAGEVLAILGPNGRGKTTLLRALAGLHRLREGRIANAAGALAYVPQSHTVPFEYSAREMTVMGRAGSIGVFGRPGRADYAAADAALERVGVAALGARSYMSLSGGERQLVLIARALASAAPLMVLDEPAAALDPRNQSQVLALIDQLACERSMAIVYTTHQPQHPLATGARVLLMLDAERSVQGSADAVLTEANLGALYGVPVRRIEIALAGRTLAGLVPIYGG